MAPNQAGYAPSVHEHRYHEPPEYLASRLHDALAADPRINQLDVVARIVEGEVVLTGSVLTHDRLEAVEAVARRVAGDRRIVNAVEVRDLAGIGEHEPVRSVRVAAVGDVHFGTDSSGQLAGHVSRLSRDADLLLVAGDLTRHGTADEARVLAEDLRPCDVPVVAVLGNHDHHADEPEAVVRELERAGVTVLEGTARTFEVRGMRVGIAGTKGFGGGFVGACGSDFGERLMKDFIGHTRLLANQLRAALVGLDADVRIALLHFSPVEGTLRGERLEIYPWLGSYLLAEAIDGAACDLAVHGHAHAGTEHGQTPGGVPVRNVAQPVIGRPYTVYCVEPAARPVLV